MFQKDWTTCSKYVNHSELNSQHILGIPMQRFNEHENRHYPNESDTQMSSENYEESGYNFNLDLLTSCTKCVFHILGDVD